MNLEKIGRNSIARQAARRVGGRGPVESEKYPDGYIGRLEGEGATPEEARHEGKKTVVRRAVGAVAATVALGAAVHYLPASEGSELAPPQPQVTTSVSVEAPTPTAPIPPIQPTH